MSEFDPKERAETGARTAAELHMFCPEAPRTLVEAAWRDFVYAEVWTRPGLDRRARFIISICGASVAPGPDALIDAYVGGALATGELSLAELREVALHLSGYAGFPRAARLDCAITRVAKDRGLDEPAVEPLRTAPWTTQSRQAENDAIFQKVCVSPGPPHVTAFYEAGVMNYCFGELWTRPGLDQRSRRLVTLVGASDSQAPSAVLAHTYAAMASGDLTKDEMLEFVQHFAVYGGHTRGSTMQALVLEMADRIEKGEPLAVAAREKERVTGETGGRDAMFQANPIVDKVRSQIDHPIIDSDGHFFEFYPVINEYLEKEGGKGFVQDFHAATRETQIDGNWHEMTVDQRRDVWRNRPVFWALQSQNTLDLATAMLPNLMYQRMDEIGLDFSVMYPGVGNIAISLEREDIRRTSCRAFNRYFADTFAEFSDRMRPVAIVPAHTPEEAVEELEYAVKVMGFKIVLFPSYVKRPIAAAARRDPAMARYAFRLDTYGVDSDYDYDPLWRKCLELKVVPTFHSPSDGMYMRNSISNYCYNHIGHFAAAGDAIAKSLFLGGVTDRFPDLKFLFLEGGVGWARSLLADLIGHWSKRNGKAIQQFNPANVDHARFQELYEQFAGSLYREGLTNPLGARLGSGEEPDFDDFARCGVKVKRDFLDRFVEPYYFGCEADDPITSSAFDALRNPLGAQLNAVMGSDISHWDVPDMREVLDEAWEPVEKGQMTLRDFRDFVFTNPVKLWTALDPDFFKGTRVESAVAKEIEPA